MIDTGRETKDLDFLLSRMQIEEKEIEGIFKEVCKLPSLDGFIFSYKSSQFLSLPHMSYPGFRILLNVQFANMKDRIQVDVGVGDKVSPQSFDIPLIKYKGEPLFEGAVSLMVYPSEAIFSEKLETVISKGAGNSRMKDFHDLTLLIRSGKIEGGEKLRKALIETFSCRGTVLKKVYFNELEIKGLQTLWESHLRNIEVSARRLSLPTDIRSVIEEVNKYIHDFIPA